MKLGAFARFNPTPSEIVGAICFSKAKLPVGWCCPVCNRAVQEIVRWYSIQKWGYTVVEHHDHSGRNRFPRTLICEDCNWVDGKVKRKYRELGLNSDDWSFSVEEIKSLIIPRPHRRPEVNFLRAVDLAIKLKKEIHSS